MIGNTGGEWFMVVGYSEPEIGVMIFWMQGIEKMEELTITYATHVTNIHDIRVPKGVSMLRVGHPKSFTVDVTVVHWGLVGCWRKGAQRRHETL
jgi:hypothetical protein